jgi:hypothetical protein
MCATLADHFSRTSYCKYTGTDTRNPGRRKIGVIVSSRITQYIEKYPSKGGFQETRDAESIRDTKHGEISPTSTKKSPKPLRGIIKKSSNGR